MATMSRNQTLARMTLVELNRQLDELDEKLASLDQTSSDYATTHDDIVDAINERLAESWYIKVRNQPPLGGAYAK